jgi:carbon monoxide dehydrogenase subunit G
MVTVSSTERVAASPEAVFAFLDTPPNHERISPSISSVHDVERLPEGGHRAGYTYRLFGIPLRGTVEAVTHDPPRRLRFTLRGGVDGEMDWRLQPREGGTLVTCEATFTVPGGPVATLLNPVVRAYNQRELDATLDRLRDLLEAG